MKIANTVALGLAATATAEVFYKETFDASWQDRWVVSDWKKEEGAAGDFVLSAGKFPGDAEADKGLQTSEDARFYAASSKMAKAFSNEGKPLVLQFSAKHEQKIDCGGGYIKIFPSSLDQEHLTGDSDYNIMFGPDICGSSTKRVHVIFNYKGTNHLIKKTVTCETDQLTHVYTLIVNPDNTYEVQIDGEKKESGDLSEDWDFLKPKMIKDPAQSKPEDWVDDSMMDDPEDVKPAGFDDIPKEIVDPEAEKPDDWDDDADGEWEAPTISNPEFKGEWVAKRIENPAYKGPWVHPEIANPEYEADDTLYKYTDNAFVGFDLWQVKAGTIFDNIIVTDSVEEAAAFAKETDNKEAEKAAFDAFQAAEKAAAEAEAAKAEAERKLAEGDDEDDDDEEEDSEDSEDSDDDDDDEEAEKPHEEL